MDLSVLIDGIKKWRSHIEIDRDKYSIEVIQRNYPTFITESLFLGDFVCADYETEKTRSKGILNERRVLISSFTDNTIWYKDFPFEGDILNEAGLHLVSVLVGPTKPDGTTNFPPLVEYIDQVFGKSVIINQCKQILAEGYYHFSITITSLIYASYPVIPSTILQAFD